MKSVTVHVPASTANLGPGFDCLGLALDLWNKTTFHLDGVGIQVKVTGLGSQSLPTDGRNLIASSALKLFSSLNLPAPKGLLIECDNSIPLDSGMGSSAAARMTGLLGANLLLGSPCSPEEIFGLATDMEGHPDNVGASLFGGLVLVTMVAGKPLVHRYDLEPLSISVALPKMYLSTDSARAALPRVVPLKDAVFNIGRTAFVVEAFRSGDMQLLGQVMEDRLHQPYRYKLIPGAEAAVEAALRAGAAAAALSGAGPSIIAFSQPVSDERSGCIVDAMVQAFADAGLESQGFPLKLACQGAWWE
jgi:homoserine kinase